MKKKILYCILCLFFLGSLEYAFAAGACPDGEQMILGNCAKPVNNFSPWKDTLPVPDKLGLPFENASSDGTTPVVKVIKETIKYAGLLAILALSWGGIQFLTSIGSEEKVKSAKRTVIYALIGVVLSVLAYAIIDIVNSLKI